MQYRLRTLLILLAIGPPVLAGTWCVYLKAIDEYRTTAVLQPVVKGLGFRPILGQESNIELEPLQIPPGLPAKSKRLPPTCGGVIQGQAH
jgi:hypothetical protein